MDHKTYSKVLDQVQLRLSALKSIDPDLDLGDGLTIRSVTEQVQETRTDIDQYNTEASVIKQKYKTIREKEGKIADLSDRIVDGIAFKFGRKSDEYKMIQSIRRNARNARNANRATAAAAKSLEPLANS
jgi:hypothetical protein